MTRKEKQRARWQQERQAGALRWIITRGVLMWGLGTALLFSLLRTLTSHVPLLHTLSIALMLFPIVGIAWGWIVWTMSEKRFHNG